MPTSDWFESSSNFKWIDLQNPTTNELKKISKNYKLHRYAVFDYLEHGHLPKQESMGNMQFVILRYLKDKQSVDDHTITEISNKIAIFYSTDTIITVHRMQQSFLRNLKMQHKEGKLESTTELVTKIVWNVLHSYDQPAIDLSNTIDEYEEIVFTKPLTKELLEELYLIRRKSSVSLKLLLLSKEIINKIPIISNDSTILQDVKDLHLKLITLYEQAHEDSTHLLEIYLSLSSKNSNEVMKVLTIFSVFLLPPTFIVGLYGMNFDFMPELHYRYSYPVVLALIIVITIIIYFWFKRKKWL